MARKTTTIVGNFQLLLIMLKIAYDQVYAHPVPEGHRFPMEKYRLLPEILRSKGLATDINFFRPDCCSTDILALTHDQKYIQAMQEGAISSSDMRKTGFIWSPELISREQIIMQGTIDCARFALQYGAALNIAGGTHHAGRATGEGFCLFNDLAVAANALLAAEEIRQVLIIDLDVHQGNGTASIFRNEERVFTFSMHGRNNYPFRKEQSDLDIELEDFTGDDRYLELLDSSLRKIRRIIAPDLILYQCGVDILSTDKFGKLAVSMKGCSERDQLVMTFAREQGIPIAAAMGGGYSPEIDTIVEAHSQTFEAAVRHFFS